MDYKNNTTCANTEISEADDAFLDIYVWWMEVFGNLSISIVGVVLNIITIVVLLTSNMRNNFFNRLLFCLAIFDNLYLICEISEVSRLLNPTAAHQRAFAYFIYPVRSVCLCSSIYMTIVLTLERYQAITSPVQYRARGGIKNDKKMTKRLLTYVLPVLGVTLIYYTPKFFDLEVVKETHCNPGASFENSSKEIDEVSHTSNCTQEYIILPSKLRTDHHYVLWYMNISNLVLTAFIPVVSLLYLSCKIYLSLNKFIRRQPSCRQTGLRQPLESIGSYQRQQRLDEKKIFILFSLVTVFVICHSLRIILNVDEFLNLPQFVKELQKGCKNQKFWDRILIPLNQLFLIINASAHFFIYVFFDHGFQQVLRRLYVIKSERHSNKTTKSTIGNHTRSQNEPPKNNNETENIELGSIKNNSV